MNRGVLMTACLLALVVLVWPASAFAMLHPQQGRFLQRDPASSFSIATQRPGTTALRAGGDRTFRQYADGMGLYTAVRSRPICLLDPSGLWSRRLDWGPSLLDDRAVSYGIGIKHILPAGIPADATQFWQVVRMTTNVWFEDGTSETKTRHIVDIVDIGGRREIRDTLSWRLGGRVICMATEASTHTDGFDSGSPDDEYEQQTNVNVGAATADHILGAMRGPKATFSTAYLYINPRCCVPIRLGPLTITVPTGEWLTVDGVGSWRSP